MSENKVPKVGDTLTVAYEIVTLGGKLILSKDQKVMVESLEIVEGHWGKGSGVWYDDKVTGVRLTKSPEITYQLSLFNETKGE